MKSDSKLLVVIGGPTASGKTTLGIELAKHYNTEIVSADSRQLYQELNIGVAKPSDEELNTVKHHFINHCSITEDYTAGRFASEANTLLDHLFQNHEVVIMVGGTGLYIKACIEGLDNSAYRNIELRNELNTVYAKQGIKALQKRLYDLDPTTQVSDPKNPQRLIRAIEIVSLGQQPLSDNLQTGTKEKRYRVIAYFLNKARGLLYEDINQRVGRMLKAGLEEEVRGLIPYRNYNALNTLGYKEFFHYFDGEVNYAECVEKIKQNSRNYAKRQLTWFRNSAKYKETVGNLETLIGEIDHFKDQNISVPIR